MIKKIKDDLEFAINITKEGKMNKNKLSFSSNDKVELISKTIDFNDKNILSLLDSGDPSFCFYLNGASNVDLYDKNRISIYYYYLRIWTLKILGDYYPPRSLNYEFLINLISKVKPTNQDELNVYNFWLLFINEAKNDKNIGKLLFTKRIKLIDYSKYKLNSISIDRVNFFEGSIRDYPNTENKYDIIYVSDKCDWINSNDETNLVNNLEKYRDNLFRLLNNNGVVICSYNDQQLERVIFEKRFDYNNLKKLKDKGGNLVDCGYYYIKK